MKNILLIILAFISLNAQSLEQLQNKLKKTDLTPAQLEQLNQKIGSVSSEKDLNYSPKTQNDSNFDNKSDVLNVDPNAPGDESVLEDDNSQTNIQINSINESNSLEYFGYQIFKGSPEAFQSSSFGSVDPNYNIGPGDKIIVMLWGESQFRQEFTIDKEGYVFIPDIGQVFVNGLNLKALEDKFFQILSKIYSTLNPTVGSPTTFMDISLGDLRPLRIIVLGEVAQPGAYSISPTASLYSSLYYFNGPTTFGSLREIRLIRSGKLVGSVDFYDYLLSGKTPNDIRLQIDDVVFIPPRGKTVSIIGEINHPGIYELKEEESLNDLLNISGNLSVTAYMKRAQVNRIVPKNNRPSIGMDRMIIDINLQSILSESEMFQVKDGDVIEIFSIEDKESNYVEIISSSISRPGRYQLELGMRVLDIITMADGLLTDAYLNIAHIKRFNEDLTTELITLNLKKVFLDEPDNNIELKYRDELFIYNKNEINNSFSEVIIDGPVKRPGRYSLEKGRTVGDMIISSGGFVQNIERAKITIARKDNARFSPKIFNFPKKGNASEFFEIGQLANPNNDINLFELENNDIISIYSDPRNKQVDLVTITGEVYYPGVYPIKSKNEKVSDIINRAGGFLPNAYPLASSFTRDDKIVKISFSKIMKNSRSKENFIIKNNDEINISAKTDLVELNGEVNQPGFYKYISNKDLKYYLKISGGLSINAEKKDIWVSYPNGESKRYNPYLPSPYILDGSIIYIGRKEESDPIDKTELAKELASILSDFLQVALTITLLMNYNSN